MTKASSGKQFFDQRRDEWLGLSDAALEKDCEFDFYKASGRGGQHRNKVSTAVRIRHLPSGITAEDASQRSQHRNRSEALKRLRRKIAIVVRCSEVEDLPRLETSVNSVDYALWTARLLDLLEVTGYSVGDAARSLGTSSSRLIKLIYRDPELWQLVNKHRQELGMIRLRQKK